jgi:PAS domain S-box-containing protein
VPTKPKILDGCPELRSRAELQTLKRKQKTAVILTENESQRLFHELEVHQIELEMQNAELRLARDEAESLRDLYSNLYDFSPVGYFTLAPTGRILMANLTGINKVGIGRSHLLGKSFATLVTPELRAVFIRTLGKVFGGDSEQSIDSKIAIKGQPLKVVTIKFKRTQNGRETHVAVVDITSRRRDQDALILSEIRYRRLFETAHDGVVLLDPETRQITDANPFMTTLLGYSHDQLVGKELFEIGLLKDQRRSREMFRQLKITEEVRYENLPLKTKDGRQQEVEVVANLYKQNDLAVIQCNIRDITARKLSDDILRRSEALLYALIEQAPVGVYVVDLQIRLLQVNPKALPIFGNVQPLIGRELEKILLILWPKRVASEVMVQFKNTLKTGEPYVSPLFTGCRRGSRLKEHYEWQLQRIILPSGEQRVVCFFSNISVRIKEESAQRRLDMMSASNLKLRQEIVHRQAIEEKLHETEYIQSCLLEHSLKQQIILRSMSHKILHAQEDERKRISRELHDVIAQTLVGINVHVAALLLESGSKLGDLPQRIVDTQKMVEKSVEVVHQFARELRPTVLDDLGLIPALRAFLKGFMETTGIRVTLKITSSIEQSSENIRTMFYRIIQEALMNVVKHACASKVAINIYKTMNETVLEIADDGHGFEVEKVTNSNKNTRLGLLGMRERAEMAGGEFSVTSELGVSTTVRVIILSRPEHSSKKNNKTTFNKTK